MRVIAGSLGGRIFAAPTGHRTHPMSDKMRGALFNMLADVTNQTVLDAFAGSGALSLEAVSRGAAKAVAIEQDRHAQRTLAENVGSLQVQQRVQLIQASAGAWLRTTSDSFDLVLLDPPYDSLQLELLQQLVQRTLPGGRVVVSWPGKQAAPSFQGFSLLSGKQYGDGSLYVFRREAATG